MDEFLWVERYRTGSMDEWVLPKTIEETLKGYVAQGEIQTHRFSGGPVVGQTENAQALVAARG